MKEQKNSPSKMGCSKKKNKSVTARCCDLEPQIETFKRGGVGR